MKEDWRSVVEAAGKPGQIEVVVPGIGRVKASKDAPLPTKYRVLLHPKDPGQKFWLARSWPADAMGKVFLGNAVLRVGAAMFPDDWTGFEPSVDTTLAELPFFHFSLRPWEIRAAIEALPEWTSFPAPGQRRGQSRDTVVQADWTAAKALRSETIAELTGPRERLAAVMAALKDAMMPKADGTAALRFFARVDATGDYDGPLPGKWWNTETYRARFYWCKIHQRAPISIGVGGDGFQWIFVDGEDLARLEARLVKPTKKPGNKEKPDSGAVAAMLLLVDGPKKLSATAAAKEVAASLPGEQSATAAARRILDKFRKAYPDKVKTYAPRQPRGG